MTRGGGGRHAAAGLMALWLALAGTAGPARSQDAPPRQALVIGFVEIAGDARYEPVKAGDRIILKTRDHPFAAAEVAIDEAQALRRVLAVDFALERIRVPSADRLASAMLHALDERNVHFFVVDAPAEAFGPLAAALRGRDVLAVQRDSRGGFAAARAVRTRARPYVSEPRHENGRAGAVSRFAQMARHPGSRGAPWGGCGDGDRLRALGEKIRRAHRRPPAFQAGHRSARARPERSAAAHRHQPRL